MAGDGINDAAAISQADAGLAMGTGADLTREAGDAILLHGEPRQILDALLLARQALRVMRQNLGWAFGYNLLGIPIAAGVLYPAFGILLSPAIASAAHGPQLRSACSPTVSACAALLHGKLEAEPRPLRILNRYILMEVLSHAAIGGAIFTFVLFIRYLPHLLEMIVRNSASLGSIVEIVFFTLPDMFTVTIPMAVLVGILLGLSRLAADSEITAMRASGIGVWSFVRVVSMVAIAGWGVSMLGHPGPRSESGRGHAPPRRVSGNAQASYEVQPRVFYEDFKDYVLYIQDVRSGAGAANWRGIFLADVTNPHAPKITTADRATVVNGPSQTITMRLRDGAESETVPVSLTSTPSPLLRRPISLCRPAPRRMCASAAAIPPILAMTNRELLDRTHSKNGSIYEIEFQKRLAYPAACLVLMLVGVPLGISSRRGGKGAGFVLTIALVFIYYFLSSTGTALARQHKIPAFLGVWQANLLFALCGIVLLRQMATGGAALSALTSLSNRFRLRAEESTASAGPLRLTARNAPPAAAFPSSSTSTCCASFS